MPTVRETEREAGAQTERAVVAARGRGVGGHGGQVAGESSGQAAGELAGRAPAAPSETEVGEHREWAAGGPTGRGAGEHREWAAGGPTGREAGALPICSPAGVALRVAERCTGEAAGQGPGEHTPRVTGALRGWEGRVAIGPHGGWAVGEGAEPQTTCEMGAAGAERGAGGGMGVPMVWTMGVPMVWATGVHTGWDGEADIWVGTAWVAAVGLEPAMKWVSRALTALFAGTETE